MRHPKISEETLKAADGTQLTNEKRRERADRRDERDLLPIGSSLQFKRPQKLRLRLCQFAAIGASIGFLAVMAPNAAAPANADGVVVKSNALSYETGDIVKNGQEIALGSDERVVVLDPSGELLTFTETSVFGAEVDRADRTLTAWDAMTWNRRRTGVGGTRTQTYEECVELAETRSDLTEEICARIHLSEAEDAPELNLKLLGNPLNTRPSAPIKLSLQANFEADVSCALRSIEGTDLPLLLGKTETGIVHLMNGTKTHVPRRGGQPVAAPQTAGSYKIACIAVQSQAVRIANDAISTAAGATEAAQDIAVKFAEISGAPLAYAEINLTIVE